MGKLQYRSGANQEPLCSYPRLESTSCRRAGDVRVGRSLDAGTTRVRSPCDLLSAARKKPELKNRSIDNPILDAIRLSAALRSQPTDKWVKFTDLLPPQQRPSPNPRQCNAPLIVPAIRLRWISVHPTEQATTAACDRRQSESVLEPYLR